MKVLVLDVGGNNVKLLATGRQNVVKIPTGPTMTPKRLVDAVLNATTDWSYDVVSIGFPAPVRDGAISAEPMNLGSGWKGYNFAAHFGKPVKLMNDAAMQALGSYDGGHMLFLGLGTGLGAALVIDGVVVPLEVAHLPFRKERSYEDYLGRRGLDYFGKKKWEKIVAEVVALFQAAFVVDYVVLGGGNAKSLEQLPPGTRLGNNRHAVLGGYRMWVPNTTSQIATE